MRDCRFVFRCRFCLCLECWSSATLVRDLFVRLGKYFQPEMAESLFMIVLSVFLSQFRFLNSAIRISMSVFVCLCVIDRDCERMAPNNVHAL